MRALYVSERYKTFSKRESELSLCGWSVVDPVILGLSAEEKEEIRRERII